MAYASNRFQRHREELKVSQEKGEMVVSDLKALSRMYLEKYNVIKTIRNADQSSRESSADEKMKAIEDRIFGATQIHFPSCKPQLEEWLKRLARADVILRHVASGSYPGEYDDLTKTTRDKSSDYIMEISSATMSFIEAITHEIARSKDTGIRTIYLKKFFRKQSL